MPAPPIPVTNAPPSATTAVQQYVQEYQQAFLNNQSAYRNIALTRNDNSLWKRATVMARAIESARREIPFGTLMARCRRESGFKLSAVEKRAPGLKYGIGPWGITTDWGNLGPNDKAPTYGVTYAEAMDPLLSTTSVVKVLYPSHRFILDVVPRVKSDLVLYSWMLMFAHAGGPGELSEARAVIQGKSDWTGYTITNPKTGKVTKTGKGLGGATVRCWRKYNQQITLANIMSVAWTKSYAYTREDGAWRLMMGSIDACIWERRRDAVLAGKVLVSETAPMLAQAIAQVHNSGQGAVLAAFKAQSAGWSRANDAVQETRQDKFKGAAQAGVDVKNQQMQQNANTIRLANAAELTGLLAPGGTIMVFNEKTGLWEP